MLTYTPNKYKGGVMLPILKEKNVTENSLAVPYYYWYWEVRSEVTYYWYRCA